MMRTFARLTHVVLLVLVFSAHWSVLAEEPVFLPVGDESANYQSEVLIVGLDNPCGLALRPTAIEESTGEFFFAESGAGRILRIGPESPGKIREVIKDLSTHPLDNREKTKVGPWTLGFLTPSKLVVVGGVVDDGNEQIGVYVLPENGEVLAAAQTDHTVGPMAVGTSDLPSFLGLTVGETAAYFSSGANSVQGQIFYSALEANRLDSFRSLLKEEGMRSPAGLCLTPVNPAGSQYLVATDSGELQEARDSQLVFFAPFSGKKLMQLDTGLFDLVGLAYSPTGQLYAIDFAWQRPELGGVYRLDDARQDGRPACQAVKIASVVQPTSLVIASNGTMLVSALGAHEKPKQGKIIKITGEF